MTDSFEHHGIKGQKWHVRRNLHPHGGEDRQASREAKAKKFVKKSNVLQKRISDLQAKPPQSLSQKFWQGDNNITIKQLQKEKAQADKNAQAKREGHLTTTQKRLLIGAAVVGTVAVGAYATKKIDSGEARQLMNRGREIVTGKKFEFKTAEELKGNWGAEEINSLIAKEINPGYMENQLGANMNCRRCTFAYELRRRGFDVQATRTPTARGQHAAGILNAITTEFPDVSDKELMKRFVEAQKAELEGRKLTDPITRHIAQIIKRGGGLQEIRPTHDLLPQDNVFSILPSAKALGNDDIFARLAKELERSRGELAVQWQGGGGHSMAYEIINGVPHIFDTQTGRYFNNVKDFTDGMPGISTASFTRLDNVELDPNFLQRWVKNVD